MPSEPPFDAPDDIGSPPRVSIGLPVKNGGGYLVETVDGLLAQTFEDFEIVIADNASTDGTERVCREYAARDPRVRYHRSDVDRGVMWNFGRVVPLSRGEYFKWASHDDLHAPTFLERCVEVLDADPSVVCCHTRTRKIDGDGEPLPGAADPTLESDGGALPRASDRFRDVVLHANYGVRSYGVIRREPLLACLPLLPVYGSEKVLMAEIALHGRYHDVDEELFFERIHVAASRSLETKEAQQAFADPRRLGLPTFPRLRLLGGYLRAIRRAPIGARERARCLAVVGRYLFQVEKWSRVARTMLRGGGVVRYGSDDEVAIRPREKSQDEAATRPREEGDDGSGS